MNSLYAILYDPMGFSDEHEPRLAEVRIVSETPKRIVLEKMHQAFNYRTRIEPQYVGGDNGWQRTPEDAWRVFYRHLRAHLAHLEEELLIGQRVLAARNGARRSRKRQERRKGPRTVHVIDKHTSYRDEVLARAELTDFLTKRA